MENILPTHPFVGTWITEEEDSDVAFSISVQEGKFQVAGFCISDGELFEITELYFTPS